ncbi:MAG: alpha/beta fold hydrolase [Candidatus Omnitrophica bacterium]|nr:alpha/beta fold hydrolase [Candidatus Omnitrophota bacterium]
MSVIFDINWKRKKSAPTATDEGLYLRGNTDKVVILIHGLTGSPQEMRFQAKFLHGKGYTVVCPRLANHGAPLEVLKKTKWQEFYQSTRAAFLQVRPQYTHVFTAGLSMGALLALLLADEFGDQLHAISCLSPTLFYDGWNAPWYKCFLPLAYRTPLKEFLYYKEEPPYGIKNEEVQRLVHRQYTNADLHDNQHAARYGYPYFPVSLFQQLDLLVKHLCRRLPNIKVPLQLIQARHDDMTSMKNSQFIYDRVNSGTKEIVLLENSYHVVTADQERGTVAQKLDNFFACASHPSRP